MPPLTPPLFDPLQIQFPSDQITMRQLREQDPLAFGPEVFDPLDYPCDAFSVHSFELDAARKAVAKARGEPDPLPNSDRRDIVSALNDAYKQYGLSTGIEQTRQMIRDFENAAVRLANARTR